MMIKKIIEHGTLLLISLQILSAIFFNLRIIPRDIVINLHRYFYKAPVILA